VLGGERSPTEWYLLLCALRVWSADPARPDGTYKEFATRVSPFSSLHDAARVVDAMQPRGVGALLHHELGWVDAHGALRRVADCLPFDDSEKPRASVCARRFWAHGQRAAADASACAPWPDMSPPGWRLLRATGGTVEAVAPDDGGMPLFWSTELLRVLTPASTHRARVIEASVLGPRRGHASTLDAAPAVLDPLAAVTFPVRRRDDGGDGRFFAHVCGARQQRRCRAAAAVALVEAAGERAAVSSVGATGARGRAPPRRP
jgi:hypothetical protein